MLIGHNEQQIKQDEVVMKKRVIWKMFALTIITLGIYRLYWFVKTRKELMSLNPKIKILSPLFIVIPVVLIIAAAVFFIATIFQSAASIPDYCNSYSSNQQFIQSTAAECQTDAEVLPILLFYVAIFAIFPMVIIWLWSYSKGVEIATKEKTSFAIALIVLLVVPDGIDILIIQDAFNKIKA